MQKVVDAAVKNKGVQNVTVSVNISYEWNVQSAEEDAAHFCWQVLLSESSDCLSNVVGENDRPIVNRETLPVSSGGDDAFHCAILRAPDRYRALFGGQRTRDGPGDQSRKQCGSSFGHTIGRLPAGARVGDGCLGSVKMSPQSWDLNDHGVVLRLQFAQRD